MEERHHQAASALCTLVFASGGVSPRIALATPITMMFCRFAIVWRCVSVAPFGCPVVPDV